MYSLPYRKTLIFAPLLRCFFYVHSLMFIVYSFVRSSELAAANPFPWYRLAKLTRWYLPCYVYVVRHIRVAVSVLAFCLGSLCPFGHSRRRRIAR